MRRLTLLLLLFLCASVAAQIELNVDASDVARTATSSWSSRPTAKPPLPSLPS